MANLTIFEQIELELPEFKYNSTNLVVIHHHFHVFFLCLRNANQKGTTLQFKEKQKQFIVIKLYSLRFAKWLLAFRYDKYITLINWEWELKLCHFSLWSLDHKLNYTMRTNLLKLLDLLIFCIYSLTFSLEFLSWFFL